DHGEEVQNGTAVQAAVIQVIVMIVHAKLFQVVVRPPAKSRDPADRFKSEVQYKTDDRRHQKAYNLIVRQGRCKATHRGKGGRKQQKPKVGSRQHAEVQGRVRHG